MLDNFALCAYFTRDKFAVLSLRLVELVNMLARAGESADPF